MMKVTSFENITLEDVNVEGAKNAKIRWLIAQKDKAPNFALRMFEVEVGGFTPFHNHPWEHESFVLEGEGELVLEDDVKPFKKWDVIYIDPNMKHQFRNTGDTLMRFLCIIPIENKTVPKKKSINPFASGTANNC